MEESILIKFGKRVRELRTERNLTQQQLADISGLHKNYIGMIERGERNPSLVNIDVLAKSFEINISELFNSPYTVNDFQPDLSGFPRSGN